ncbi:MAG: carbohydrate ABC transporter permease [Chloroflexi bacterium]|nr:MAG: sugar ABC transporter permease [Actinobacteria bacterium 13_2_20CM_2_66_6]TME08976.1 MAG: carbohydrate ABC transporter permease [Chloroflexota bacterium]TME92440.1 MAG: carbohydrate ABC transporter permease [Chloroflexota bacterium]
MVARAQAVTAARWVVLVFFALLCAFPFAWATFTSFKADADLYTVGHVPFLYNLPPTFDHVRVLFQETEFLTFVRNSFEIGVIVVAITLATAVPAAYAIARLTGEWGGRLAMAVFVIYLVPPTLLFLPLSRIVAELGLQDSIWALVLVYPTLTAPFSTWLLVGFFRSIPRDIEEQAMVDGYSRAGAVVRTVLPLALPGLLTVVIFTFALTTNDFVYAVAFISSSSNMTISAGVPVELIRGDVFFWQSLMAATVLVAIPVALAYNFFLDRFVQGLALGGVKG